MAKRRPGGGASRLANKISCSRIWVLVLELSWRPVGVSSKTLKLEVNPFTQETIEVNRDDIDESYPGKTSPMPSGLLDTLNKEEIKDLIAYLIRAAKHN